MSSISPTVIRLKNNLEVIVRSAGPEDAEELLELTKTILAENDFNITTTEEFLFTVEQEMEWLENVLISPKQIVIVAEHSGHLLGLINFHTDPRKRMQHQGSLSINIHRSWRDQGLGRAILQALISWAKDEPGIEKLTLEVFHTNTRAIALYQSVGFQEEARHSKQIKMDTDVYIDVIYMSMRLNQTTL